MSRRHLYSVSLLVLCGLSCASPHGGGAEAVAVGSKRVGLTQDARQGSEPLKDGPATELVDRVRAAFRAGAVDTVQFRVYQLEAPDSSRSGLQDRALELGLSGHDVGGEERGAIRFDAGKFQLVRNRLNGGEFFADMTRFHAGSGVGRDDLLPEREYVNIARNYVSQRFRGLSELSSLYPYKVWTYMNATGAEKGAADTEEAYQVAVFFNSSIDGIPVIGSGAKVAVHMTPQGEPIAHRSTLRATVGEGLPVPPEEFLSPDEARAQVEGRLSARGVNLDDYALEREELGYYRRGRNSTQEWVAPHYAYFYSPRSGVVSKKLVETIPALTGGDLLALVERDEEMERARKDAHLARAGELTERP